jgi:hypothetical protein
VRPLLLLIPVCQMALANEDIHTQCERVLPIVSDLKTKDLNELYSLKRHNNNQWQKTDKISDVFYDLQPKEIIKYEFSWEIINSGGDDNDLKSGELICESADSWQLVLNSAVNVAYPPAVHNKKEEDSIYNIETFAGIYLAKSKHIYYPNTVGLIWYLIQPEIPELIEDKILNKFKFISRDMLEITKIENFDKSNYAQLIALRISNQQDIEQGNQLWLISNDIDHRPRREGSIGSRRNEWLPWLNVSNPEFLAQTPIDAYTNTIVAPVGRLIYDRKNKIFIPEPISIEKNAQAIYDIISPPVRNSIDNQQPLFAFLLFKHSHNYQLMRFEIGQDGHIENRFTLLLKDPSQMGLPGAQELGFSSFPNK